MYFNHQLHYSVSSTASSTRERFFFLDLFYFQSIENSVDNFCWYGKRDRKRKHIKNESCPTTFLRQSREFLAGMGATPHISSCLSFLSKAKFFFCTSKGVIHWRAYNEYSNRHAPDYIFKNGIATRYGGNIKDLSCDSPRFHPESRDPCVEGRGGGRRRVTWSRVFIFFLISFTSSPWRCIWTASWWGCHRCRRSGRFWWRKWRVRAIWLDSIGRGRSTRCSGWEPWSFQRTSWRRRDGPKEPSRAQWRWCTTTFCSRSCTQPL